MTRCTLKLRNNSDNWQATRGAQLDKNRQSEFALRIRHVCAHCVHTLPPSRSLSHTVSLSLSSLSMPTDIYQAKAHGLLIHIRNCVTVCRPRVSVSICVSVCVSFFFSVSACAGVRSGCGRGCGQDVSCELRRLHAAIKK